MYIPLLKLTRGHVDNTYRNGEKKHTRHKPTPIHDHNTTPAKILKVLNLFNHKNNQKIHSKEGINLLEKRIFGVNFYTTECMYTCIYICICIYAHKHAHTHEGKS
jgi:hypothetical protein